MAYPTDLDSFTNPQANDTRDNPSLSSTITQLQESTQALQEKVGVDSSAVTTSLDYLVSDLDTQISNLTSYLRPWVYQTDATLNWAPGVAGYADVPGWSLSVTTTEASDMLIDVGCLFATNTIYGFSLRVERDGAAVGTADSSLRTNTSGNKSQTSLVFVDEDVAAGSYTYTVALSPAGSTSADVDLENRHLIIRQADIR